jgi:TonB-dependent starch-binding outer membrane protein SusC
MDLNLRKILIRMSKLCIYGIIVQLSLYTFVFAIDSNAQGQSVYDIQVNLGIKSSVKLDKVIEKIEKSTNFHFAYIDQQLVKTSNCEVKMAAGEMSLGQVLKSISDQTQISFRRVNNNIFLREMKDGVDAITEVIDEQVTISGKILDENGEGLPGATVIEKGTVNGTITDFEGFYSMKVTEGAIILISFVGYLPQEIPVSGRSVIDVRMIPDLETLEEIVVVGYGTVKKSDLTGSVVKVKQEDIKALPVTNALEALQGKVAGMDLTRESGETGSGLNIRVRGTRSITATNGPLIIVDGMPYGENLDIPPSEIESIEVLKDASSTAIYGARGANGVVLITTKRGKSGQSRITFNTYTGVSKIAGYPEFTLGQDWVDMRREAYKTVGKPLTLKDEQIFGFSYPLVAAGNEVNWQDLIFQDGVIKNYQLGASGGNDKTSYSLAADYIDEKGIMKLDNYSRFLVRTTLDHKINKWINLGTSLQFSRADRDRRGNPLNQANKQPPFAIPFNEDGSINFAPFGDGSIINPLADEIPDAYVNQTLTRRVMNNSYITVKPFEFLTLKSSISFTYNDDRTGFYAAQKSLARSNQVSEAKYESKINDQYQFENTATLDKKSGVHSIQVVAGNAFLGITTEQYNIRAINVAIDNMKFYNLSSSTLDQRDINSSYSKQTLLSYFGRINYSLMDKYLLTLVYRADGASQLTPGRKWSSFPSAAVAWKVSEESFMKNQNIVSFLKLRGSYGVAGNYAVDPYQTNSRLGQTMYSWGESTPAPGWYLRGQAADDIGWENTATINLGVDFGIFADRITFTFERYITHTTDLLLEKKLPFGTGYSSVLSNVGETENKGYEAIVSSTNINTTGGFKWTSDFTFSANREKIVKLADGITEDIANGWFVGHPIEVFYDYEKIGIWQLGEEDAAKAFRNTLSPGEIKVLDYDGDSILTVGDKHILGTTRPKWTLGVNNKFEYKGFDFTIFVFARVGQMINSELHSRFDRAALGVSYKANYWTEENPTNDYPRPNRLDANRDLITTLGYVDGSFVKIRNMSLGYTVPKSLSQRVGVSQLRVYSTMKNYFTFSQLAPYDPERGGSASFPMTKQWIFGMNLTF